ncbi:hypothetical protein RHMOL_Rhmol13G0041300 [Rhododendron molle]|uniref:Uncharacterized protein n=2 Tax=Rhododendron molle TaxID=49168 RepID=A0ACC0L396_RHOML|nr:hypothetical protein RHMOL_Rhmol13G0041300 [Rhododendron molle]KAI8523012.1 hypothetical protein RHMOL_Rhmol13G0041300 [Rhododendron molle]
MSTIIKRLNRRVQDLGALALVTEICFLCIRRNLVERMIELPWNSLEEKYIHKCLLDFAVDYPSTTIGSLLVVFYLQRYRYVEAYQVDRKLQSVEQDFIANNSVGEEALFRMKSASHWRVGLFDFRNHEQGVCFCVLYTFSVASQHVKLIVEIPAIPGLAKLQPPISMSLLVPTSVDSSLFSRKNETITSSKPSVLENPSKPGEFGCKSHLDLGNHGSPSILQGSFFRDLERVPKPQSGVNKKFKFDDIRTPCIRRVSPMRATPLKEFNRSVPQNRSFEDHQLDEEVSPQKEEKRVHSQISKYQTIFPWGWS